MKIFPQRSADSCALRRRGGFTLIEIMVVVAVMGLIMAMGLPAIIGGLKQEGMRRAVNDVVEGCRQARSQAILGGAVAELRYATQARTLSAGSFSATLPADIAVEMWDVNLREFKDEEEARVRFYPNGMSDEMTVILRSDKGDWKKITLEITTGRSTVGGVR